MEEAIACHCHIPKHLKESSKNLPDAVDFYSNLINKIKEDDQEFTELGLCANCRQMKCEQSRKEALSLAYNERGQLQYLSVNFSDAIKDYTASVELNPTPVALYNRGQIYYRLCSYEKAAQDFKDALMYQGDFKEAQFGLDACRQAMKRASNNAENM